MPTFKVTTSDDHLTSGLPEPTEHSLAVALQAYRASVQQMHDGMLAPELARLQDIIDGQEITIHHLRGEMRDATLLPPIVKSLEDDLAGWVSAWRDLNERQVKILDVVRCFIDEGGCDYDAEFVEQMVALGMKPFEREVTGSVTVSYTVEFTISDVPSSISDEMIRRELLASLVDNVETGGCNFYLSPCDDINDQVYVEFDSSCDPTIDSLNVDSF